MGMETKSMLGSCFGKQFLFSKIMKTRRIKKIVRTRFVLFFFFLKDTKNKKNTKFK